MDQLGFGAKESLSVRQRFLLDLLIDRRDYLAQTDDISVDTEDLVDHYIRAGLARKLEPSPTFRSALYLDVMLGLRETGQDPFLHYLRNVVDEQALIDTLDGLHEADVAKLRASFDADWYLQTYPDVERAAHDSLVHYLTLGWREGRDPSPSFSTGAYLDLHADVHDSGMNPFRHWVLHGIGEGRRSGKAPSFRDTMKSLTESAREVLTRMFDDETFRDYVENAGQNDSLSLAVHFGLGSTNAKADLSFRAARYVAAHPEVAGSVKIPLLHYLFDVVGEQALREMFVDKPAGFVRAIYENFDAAWYLYSYPDVEASGQDALIHYMTIGWRQNRDPSQDFSTQAYLLRYPDIVEAGVQPFQHWVTFGKSEERSGVSTTRNFRNRAYAPSITVILVNDAADPLTPGCFSPIARQTYDDLTFLVVGAPLSDECRAALEMGLEHEMIVGYLPGEATDTLNLLQRASELAASDLLWFVRGHMVHDFEFLARVTSSFADNSVQLGFGRRIEPHDPSFAVAQDELARRMEGWTKHVTTPAAVWFPERLRSGDIVADQYSFLWRRRPLGDGVWRQAASYRRLGLWHLCLHMASGGQIAAVRDALMRFPTASRPMHSDDDDVRSDIARFSAEVRCFWPLPGDAIKPSAQAATARRHVLIVTHGIFAGGAENLPIQLANELIARGIIVSMLIFKIDLNHEMRATLNPGVSIYEADWVMEYGCERFLSDIGCSLIHSHGVIGEMFFFRLCEGPLPAPYVATLHGSYEASSSVELPEQFIAKIVRNIDLFIYTANKNLVPLLRHGVNPNRVIKMINAMPVDDAAFPRSRADMGIAEDAVVFTLVGRGIPEKGWSTAINAFRVVRDLIPHRSMHLCLVGEGDEQTRLRPIYAADPSISFLGFQLRIPGLYRMTDVAIVPTRFAGESFPLCIIQALQASVPVIATDVGEIASMLRVDGVVGGIVVEGSPIDAIFDARFIEGMHSLMDDERRARFTRDAGILGRGYDMGAFTDQYVEVYERVIREFAKSRSVPVAAHVVRDAVNVV